MNPRKRPSLVLVTWIAGAGPARASDECDREKRLDESYMPMLDPADFQATIDHPLLPYQAGAHWLYEGGGETIEVTVTTNTKVILGINATVVRSADLISVTVHRAPMTGRRRPRGCVGSSPRGNQITTLFRSAPSGVWLRFRRPVPRRKRLVHHLFDRQRPFPPATRTYVQSWRHLLVCQRIHGVELALRLCVRGCLGFGVESFEPASCVLGKVPAVFGHQGRIDHSGALAKGTLDGLRHLSHGLASILSSVAVQCTIARS